MRDHLEPERDPAIDAFFASGREDFAGERFTAEVMSETARLNRRTVAGWVFVGLVLISGAWLLAAPLHDVASLLTQILPIRLADAGDRWIARMLSPANSIAGALALAFLGLHMVYRKIFS